MKAFWDFLLLLVLCHQCQANDMLFQAPDHEDTVQTTEAELQLDIWAELRELRDMVVEQKVELRQLKERVTAAESLVEATQEKNKAMETRMIAAEVLAEELQMENDAQAAELAVAQQKLSNVQGRLAISEGHMEELEKQQEGQNVIVQELQNVNKVRKVAFSASLLASGEGNTGSEDFVTLIYRNVFINAGNHYNPNTGYFTAPVRGAYFFRFTGHAALSDRYCMIRLVKNGEGMIFTGDVPITSADREDNGSNGVVLQLEVGDVVSLQVAGDVWDDQYHRTTFSGFLLFTL